mgnify:CR=1 FL=1
MRMAVVIIIMGPVPELAVVILKTCGKVGV